LFTPPLYCAERVLINQVNQPGYSENWYPGRRGRVLRRRDAGDRRQVRHADQLKIRRSNDATEFQYIDYPRLWRQCLESDRAGPHAAGFPNMINVTASPEYKLGQTITSPMARTPPSRIWARSSASAALDLFSVRSFKSVGSDIVTVPLSISNPSGGTGLPAIVTIRR